MRLNDDRQLAELLRAKRARVQRQAVRAAQAAAAARAAREAQNRAEEEVARFDAMRPALLAEIYVDMVSGRRASRCMQAHAATLAEISAAAAGLRRNRDAAETDAATSAEASRAARAAQLKAARDYEAAGALCERVFREIAEAADTLEEAEADDLARPPTGLAR